MGDVEEDSKRNESFGTVLCTGSCMQLAVVRLAPVDVGDHVPAGVWHNIVNTGDADPKLHWLYSPAVHAEGSVHTPVPMRTRRNGPRTRSERRSLPASAARVARKQEQGCLR